jgi:hypothetical protein
VLIAQHASLKEATMEYRRQRRANASSCSLHLQDSHVLRMARCRPTKGARRTRILVNVASPVYAWKWLLVSLPGQSEHLTLYRA